MKAKAAPVEGRLFIVPNGAWEHILMAAVHDIWYNSHKMAIQKDVIEMAQTVVRALVEDELKAKAQAELAKQGLTLSDLMRMALREAAEGRITFSFDGTVRNRETLSAMEELDSGKGERASSIEDFHRMMNS